MDLLFSSLMLLVWNKGTIILEKSILYGILVYSVIASLITFILFGIDKQRAKQHQWRISERTLIVLCFLGGAFGGWLGMTAFRHKTKHLKFRILIPLSVVFWLVLVAGMVYVYMAGGFAAFAGAGT